MGESVGSAANENFGGAPEPQARPKLALWLWERGMDLRQAAELFGHGITPEAVRLWCLPFGDPNRRQPRPANRIIIAAATANEVGPDDWDPPEAAR